MHRVNYIFVYEKATVVITFKGDYDGTFRKWFKITQDPGTNEFEGEWVTVTPRLNKRQISKSLSM